MPLMYNYGENFILSNDKTTGGTSPVVIYSDKSKIYITTITDRSISTNSNVTLEYTKTTDA